MAEDGTDVLDSDSEGPCSVTTTLFGKYEVGRLLGCGAFAKVYYGREVRTGQSVAIKKVSRRKIVKGGLVGHVKREISIMGRVRHPNVVKLLEVLATRSKIYFVMEFAKGGELFTKLTKGRFSEDLSRHYFQQLITAVGYCHSRGVFHRDLKPENLLLDENWDLKVSDFGLSAVHDQVRPDGLLHTLCGTPAYVAPEILAKKGYEGAKVDVWSCGIILFVLVAGYLPFNDTNLMVLYRKIYNGKFRCPEWTSPELRRFLSRVLDTNPDTRITVDEIVKDPWFTQDYDNNNSNCNYNSLEDDFDLKVDYNDNDNDNKQKLSTFLNAFDIISLSPGLDLSGMFSAQQGSGFLTRCDRFLSSETPCTILESVEKVGRKELGLAVTKRIDWGTKLEGCNGHFGKMVLVIEIYRITVKLVVVHVKERDEKEKEEDELVGPTLGVWKDKLRPHLGGLVYDDDKRRVAVGS